VRGLPLLDGAIKENNMFGIGFPELIIILIIGLIVLGPDKLPDLAKAIAKGLGEFRKATQEIKQNLDIDENLKEIKQNLDGSIKDLKDNIAESMSGIDNPLKEINELKSEIAKSVSELNNPIEEALTAVNSAEPAAVGSAGEAEAGTTTGNEPASVTEPASSPELEIHSDITSEAQPTTNEEQRPAATVTTDPLAAGDSTEQSALVAESTEPAESTEVAESAPAGSREKA
jgi:Tat protein translocase TatB subunit